jgi:large conductance mechanosensitive channel
MLRRLDDLARSDLITFAVGLLIALATFELVKSVVENLIMPIIFALFGQSEFPYLSFSIGDAEFAYGFVISTALAFVIVCLLVILLGKVHRKYDDESRTRACPECLTPIPSAAKRCPECTAVVTPEAA